MALSKPYGDPPKDGSLVYFFIPLDGNDDTLDQVSARFDTYTSTWRDHINNEVDVSNHQGWDTANK